MVSLRKEYSKKKILLLFVALTKHGILFKQQKLGYTCMSYGILSIIRRERNNLTKTSDGTEEIKWADQGQRDLRWITRCSKPFPPILL
jgi:hypothetical protein